MAPTYEQVEQFFMDMSSEMQDMGFFVLDNLMDNYPDQWRGLRTVDQLRYIEVEAQTDSEDESTPSH